MWMEGVLGLQQLQCNKLDELEPLYPTMLWMVVVRNPGGFTCICFAE